MKQVEESIFEKNAIKNKEYIFLIILGLLAESI